MIQCSMMVNFNCAEAGLTSKWGWILPAVQWWYQSKTPPRNLLHRDRQWYKRCKMHVLQIARVAHCMCCKLHALQISSVANRICCKLHVLQIEHVANCMCCKSQILQITCVARGLNWQRCKVARLQRWKGPSCQVSKFPRYRGAKVQSAKVLWC